MTADEAIAIITGAQAMVMNRDPDKFVAAIDRALIALRLERQRDNPQPLTIEEQRRNIRLRVGIGDIVYAIMGDQIVPMEVQYIYISSKGRVRYHAADAVFKKNFRDPAFGRDVFVSMENAEHKLQQIKEVQG